MTAPASRPGTEADLDRFRQLLRQVSGLELPAGRRADLHRAVARAMAATGLADADALYRHLRDQRGRATLERFVGDLTVGETHFFRNRPQFEALEHHILPEIIERRRGSRRLRLWSAACSTGEEPYSLAILLERLLGDRARWDVHILATDINREALERARRGRYGAWSFRDVPEEVATAFFTRHGATLEVDRRIREAVTFAHLNLADDAWPSAASDTIDLDLVLCRNVLLYFGDALTRQVAARLHGALADGGWLLVAPAELSQDVFRRFAVCNLGGAVAYRKTPPEPTASGPAGPARPPVSERRPAGAPAPRSTRPYPAPAPRPRPAPMPRPGSDPGLGRADDDPDGRAALLAARGHLDRLELDQAQEWAEDACRRAPLSAEAHHVRGLVLAEAGRPDEALAAVRRSVFLDPRSVLGQVALADLLARLGEPTRARSALRAAAALLGQVDPGAPVDGHDGPAAGRVRDLIEARLARLDDDPEAGREP